MEKSLASYANFATLDIRMGTIFKAEVFEKARIPAYKLWIDFGELGELKSSAQITELYSCEELLGKQIIAVVNFPKKQIADFMSECLVLGAIAPDGVILLSTERKVKDGIQIA